MMNITKGEQSPEPKGTPEDKKVPEVQPKSPEGSPEEARPSETESAEKLKSMESELGRFKQELGDERKKVEELNAYKVWYDQNAARAQQQVPQQPKQEAPNMDEQFFDKPTETVQKILSQYEMRRQYNEAYQQAPSAFAQAKMMYPDRFEGVDDSMVQQIMYAPVQEGRMAPAVLKDPNLWAGAAWIAKGAQTQYKMPDPGLNPMQPDTTERPSASRSGDETEIPEIRGDALTDQLIEELIATGITREEALKEIQATKDEGRD